MKMQKQHNDSCLLYSFAMALEVPAGDLYKEIGHDGQEIWFPQLPFGSPRKRSFHIQEMIDCCLSRGVAAVPVELEPRLCPQGLPSLARDVWDQERAHARFNNLISGRTAVLIGRGRNNGGHACAWDGSMVFDPRGYVYGVMDFKIAQAYLILQSNQT